MPVKLHGRSLLSLFDLTLEEINYLLQLSSIIKMKTYVKKDSGLLKRKNIALIFNQPSTRTRCAFETAIFYEGGNASFISNSHMGYKETIEDTAIVLSKYYDGIGFRSHDHHQLECLAKYASIPVWNALTCQEHPTQTLADLMTIQEHIHKPLSEVKCVYVGDGDNNVAHSLNIGAAKTGMHLTNLGPKPLWPSTEFLESIAFACNANHTKIQCSENIDSAVKGADIIYTDVWISIGEILNWESRIDILKHYQVNQTMLEKTDNENIIFMHCLPSLHNTKSIVGEEIEKKFGLSSMEVTDDVFYSKHSVVFDQAENRLHTLKAIMATTIGNLS